MSSNFQMKGLLLLLAFLGVISALQKFSSMQLGPWATLLAMLAT